MAIKKGWRLPECIHYTVGWLEWEPRYAGFFAPILLAVNFRQGGLPVRRKSLLLKMIVLERVLR